MEDRLDRPALHHLALVHHQHVVGDLRHHAHVVGDEHHRHAVLGLQALDQVEDLGLGGDVERGGRLVGDQQRRIAGERHGDHGALAHAAGELEGVAVDRALRIGDLDLPQQVDGARAGRLLAHAPVQPQHLDDLVADGVHRRERRHRLLEDHRDLVAAHGADGAALRAQLGEIDRPCHPGAVNSHRAGHDAAGRIDDLQDRARRHALARAAFADDRRACGRAATSNDTPSTAFTRPLRTGKCVARSRTCRITSRSAARRRQLVGWCDGVQHGYLL